MLTSLHPNPRNPQGGGMMIKYNLKTEVDIVDYSNEIGIDVVVEDRGTNRSNHATHRYYARFEDSETKESDMLVSTSGDGHTPKEAIRDYCEQISCKKLVINAYGKDKRKEYDVPVLVFNSKESIDA